MGFGPASPDAGFAVRSARYLARNGYPPCQIVQVLVDELDVARGEASEIAERVAA